MSTITVHVKTTGGEKLSVSDFDPNATVGELKARIAPLCDCPADQQRLIFKGMVLKDDRTLLSYAIGDGQTLILVKGTKKTTPAAAPAPAATPAPAAASTGASPAAAPAAATGGLGGFRFPFPTGAAAASGAASGTGTPSGTAPSPFASMFGGAGAGGMGSLADIQRQMMENPEMMREMMDSPLTAALLDNPELVRSMIMSNPEMRALIDRNPELASFLSDPAIIRQSLEMARNPELMREMMRTTDRAMTNIETHPEGFNALRRMYETFQEPMLSAARDSTATPDPETRISPDEPTGTDAPPDSAPLPNPWAPRGTGSTGATGSSAATPAPTGGAPGTGGFGGFPFGAMGGLGGLGAMGGGASPFGGMPMDPDAIATALEDPAMQAMMRSVLSNPETLEMMMSMNPMMRSMMEANPGMRAMLRSPEVLASLSDPNFIRGMLSMQAAMRGGSGAPATSPFGFPPATGGTATSGTGATGATTGAATGATGATPGAATGTTPPFPFFPGMFGAFPPASGASSGAATGTASSGSGAPPAFPGAFPGFFPYGAPPTASRPSAAAAAPEVRPEILYREQLDTLNQMGFTDPVANINALIRTGGNVNAAVERLLSGGF